MAQASGYPGEIILINEPMAHISDCRVEWANGGAERNFSKLLETIESTLQLFIEAPENPTSVTDGENDPERGTISEVITG